ncbi:metal chaperone [Klebsiella pneumoniae]|nr:metal chaperone [Klebsiella pneumoniae]
MTRTNLITGFLGSGKTTSILHLLAQKPADEKWAVLVNEFGEVGIDGALLADSGALLKEIPGGCMCCVNGLPMQVGLNTLLRQGKPDRLLIEPTGLGHPKQILDILTAAVYEPWIDLRATLCILDPRQLLDERAVSNDNFRDQLAAADIIVANKSDRETAESARALADWWQRWGGERRKVSAIQGNIDLALLDEPRRNTAPLPASAEHAPPPSPHFRPRRAQPGGTPALAPPSQQWPGLSGAAAGSSTRRRFLTPSACSNGPGWRQWGALKA